MKISKKSFIVKHKSIEDVLSNPSSTLAQSNGCLSPKKDKAVSLALLACFLAIENIERDVVENIECKIKQESDRSNLLNSTPNVENTTVTDITIRKIFRRIFRENIIKNLRKFNISEPLKVNSLILFLFIIH